MANKKATNKPQPSKVQVVQDKDVKLNPKSQAHVSEEVVAVEDEKNQAGVEEAPKGSYVIAQEFHDIVDFSKVYKVGEAAPKFSGKRTQELLESGLIKEK